MGRRIIKQYSYLFLLPSLICWMAKTSRGMNEKKKNSQKKGFSLIELMVVVVIIGILSSASVSQYQRFRIKVKRSEVKSLLSAMYMAQKAFFSEWNQYYGDFNAVGYGLEGNVGWYVGFNPSRGATGPLLHPSSQYRSRLPTIYDSITFCNQPGVGCTNSRAGALALTYKRKSDIEFTWFFFTATADLDSDDVHLDWWHIDEKRDLKLVLDDTVYN